MKGLMHIIQTMAAGIHMLPSEDICTVG